MDLPQARTHDFQIGDVAYRQQTLSPVVAFGVVTKFGAVLKHLPGLMKAARTVAERAAAGEGGAGLADALLDADMGTVLGPIGQVISDLPDEYRDYIVEAALRVTYRASGPGFLPTWDPVARAPVADVDFPTLLIILYHTGRLQIAPFFGALASRFSGPAAA